MNAQTALQKRLDDCKLMVVVKDSPCPLRIYQKGAYQESIQNFNTWDEVSAFMDGLSYYRKVCIL